MLNKFSAWGSVIKHYLDKFLCVLTGYFLCHAIFDVVVHSYYSRPGHLQLYIEPAIEFLGSILVQAVLLILLLKKFPKADVWLMFLLTDIFTDVLQIALIKL